MKTRKEHTMIQRGQKGEQRKVVLRPGMPRVNKNAERKSFFFLPRCVMICAYNIITGQRLYWPY